MSRSRHTGRWRYSHIRSPGSPPLPRPRCPWMFPPLSPARRQPGLRGPASPSTAHRPHTPPRPEYSRWRQVPGNPHEQSRSRRRFAHKGSWMHRHAQPSLLRAGFPRRPPPPRMYPGQRLNRIRTSRCARESRRAPGRRPPDSRWGAGRITCPGPRHRPPPGSPRPGTRRCLPPAPIRYPYRARARPPRRLAVRVCSSHRRCHPSLRRQGPISARPPRPWHGLLTRGRSRRPSRHRLRRTGRLTSRRHRSPPSSRRHRQHRPGRRWIRCARTQRPAGARRHLERAHGNRHRPCTSATWRSS